MVGTINLSSEIHSDELALIRLSSDKLIKMLRGTLSIGTPALVTGVPAPESFLTEQFRRFDAYATVLDTSAGVPSFSESIPRMRHHSGQLQRSLQTLCHSLIAVRFDDSIKEIDPFKECRQAVNEVCSSLKGYLDSLGWDNAKATELQEFAHLMFDATIQLKKSS